jgi:hypothetical protein
MLLHTPDYSRVFFTSVCIGSIGCQLEKYVVAVLFVTSCWNIGFIAEKIADERSASGVLVLIKKRIKSFFFNSSVKVNL